MRHVVLDEADLLLGGGFAEATLKLLEVGESRQGSLTDEVNDTCR